MDKADLPDKVMANLLDSPGADETILTRWSHCVLTGSSGATLGRGGFEDLAEPEVNARTVFRAGETERADYLVTGLLGEGGMGVVLEAEQVYFGRRVALKMIKPALASDPMAVKAFFREAIITSRLDHPGIVPILDFGVSQDGRAFYVMKKAGGIPWSEALGDNTFQGNLDILYRVADIVAYANAGGLLHRDIKPANVMLGEFGEIWLGDWGVALRRDENGGFPHAHPGGTPQYMPPEAAVCRFDILSPRSDVYLLGAVLFEIVTGRPPHPGDASTECLAAAAANIIQPAAGDGELLAIAMRAMDTEPHRRFPDARQFQSAVKACLDNRRVAELTKDGERELGRALESGRYELFTQAIAAFDAALGIRKDNREARIGRAKAIMAYAEAAEGRGEYALALSVLEGLSGDRQALALEKRIRTNQGRDKRKRRNSRAATVAGLLVLLGGLAAAGWYYNYRRLEEEKFLDRPLMRQERMVQDEHYLVHELGSALLGLKTLVREPAMRQRYDRAPDPGDTGTSYGTIALRLHTILEEIWEGHSLPSGLDLKAYHRFCRKAVPFRDDLDELRQLAGEEAALEKGTSAKRLGYLAERIGHALVFLDGYRDKYLGEE